MIKAFRLKLLELCKTRTKKSSPGKFNFYVILAGKNIITDASSTTTCRCKTTADDYNQKVQKKKDLPRSWVLTGKQVEDFRQKKEQKHYSRHFKKKHSGTQGP